MAMDVAAAKATEEPREGRESRKARRAASQMVRMGERNLSSTLWKKRGCVVSVPNHHYPTPNSQIHISERERK